MLWEGAFCALGIPCTGSAESRCVRWVVRLVPIARGVASGGNSRGWFHYLLCSLPI